MAEENNASFPQAREGGAGRGGRTGGNRESGGFRIRLSENELRAVRAIQDAFNLRSTVAALGFSVRTLAQMLEDGQLDALVAEQRANGAGRPEGRREGRRGEGRPDGRSERGAGGGGGRANPFARPQKPVPVAAAETIAAESEAAADDVTGSEDATAIDSAGEADSADVAEASTEA